MKIGYTAKLAVHLLCAVCLISLLPLRTSAWGVKGHRVVARIAAKHLTPKTRAAIVAILRSDEEDIGSVQAIAFGCGSARVRIGLGGRSTGQQEVSPVREHLQFALREHPDLLAGRGKTLRRET